MSVAPAVDLEILDESALEGDVPCEFNHRRTTCTVHVTHRGRSCQGERNVCDVAAATMHERMSRPHKSVCWVRRLRPRLLDGSPHMTGFTAKTRALILERDGGCAWCGRVDEPVQIHHRAPRQMGGAKAAWVNLPSNGVALCLTHHAHVEKQRNQAQQLGFIIRRGIHLPHEIAIRHSQWSVCFLTVDGGISYSPPE